MRKTLIPILLLTVAMAANAQNMYDALNFSENNYAGSARTIGLNNAVTALGSDLGTVGINPAGSAVASYSQFTVTPSITMSATSSDFYDDNDVFGDNALRRRINMPNIGMTFTMKTHRTRGLKSMTFGLISNTTSNYLDRVNAYGAGKNTSMFGAFASLAESMKCDPERLSIPTAYYDTNYPWNYITAYQSGQISEFGGGHFVGATEQISQREDGTYDIYTAGMLDRNYLRKVNGSKYDIVINYGMNFSDWLFVGVNLGMPVVTYKFYENFSETAQNPSDFSFEYDTGEKVSFLSGRNEYAYSASMSGIYAKVGVIALPFQGLRLGAAVQTPTLFEVKERFQVSGTTEFTNGRKTAASPEGEYSYYLASPFRFNLGAAYTLGKFALVSADYEHCNYNQMRYHSYDSDGFGSDAEFSDVNRDIRTYAGASDIVRIGVELKPVPKIALRGGYSYTTNNTDFVDTHTDSWAVGFGYLSDSSFFFDTAVRWTGYPVSYYTPYSYSSDVDIKTPEISLSRTLWEVVATFGWRF